MKAEEEVEGVGLVAGDQVSKEVGEEGREEEIMVEVADLVEGGAEAVDEEEGIAQNSTGIYFSCLRAKSCCQLSYLHFQKSGVTMLVENCHPWI